MSPRPAQPKVFRSTPASPSAWKDSPTSCTAGSQPPPARQELEPARQHRSRRNIDLVVSGNRCYDDQGVKTQTYGVQSLGTADFNIVVGNNCRGNLTGNVTLVGSNNVNANNL